MTLTRREFAATLAAGLAMPAILKSARAEGSTIRIGMVVPITGAAAESGKFAQIGAKLALDRINKAGGVLGKQLELVTEDDQTTNSGAVLAFSKLSSQPDIVAFLGSVRSTQVHAMAPDLAKVEKPMMAGGTDPTLTHEGAKWLFRCRPNDSYSGRVIAAYGIETLAKKKWAVVHSTDAFGSAGAKALNAAIGETGGTVVLDQRRVARLQRRGQVDDAEGNFRARRAGLGRNPLRGEIHRRPRPGSDRQARHRTCARGTADLPRIDGARKYHARRIEPPRVDPVDPARGGRDVRSLS
jgi:ABC-type branched-subunit amino acid transport system substrate-binding protein